MNLLAIAALAISLILPATVSAEEAQAGAGGVSATFTNRAVFKTNEGNEGLVRRFDGKQYDGWESAFDFSADGDLLGSFSYLDLGVDGINSTEEGAGLDMGVGSFFRLKGDFDTITHRQPMFRYAQIFNGAWRANRTMDRLSVNPAYDAENYGSKYPLGDQLWFQKRSFDTEASFRPGIPYLDYVAFRYAGAYTDGRTIARHATNTAMANRAPVDHRVNDYGAGFGVALGEEARAGYDYNYRDFQDHVVGPFAVQSSTATAGFGGFTGGYQFPIKTQAPHFGQNTHQIRFRAHPMENLAFSGSLTNNSRKNFDNGYLNRAFTGTLNATYTGIPGLSITNRLFVRNVSILENHMYMWDNHGVKMALGEDTGGKYRSQIDKFTVTDSLDFRYEVVEHVHVVAGYKLEHNTRANAPAERFTSRMVFYNQPWGPNNLTIDENTTANSVAAQDTKHRMHAGVEAELPYDAEFSAYYKRMIANRAALESMPTWSEDMGLNFHLPLPRGFWAEIGADHFGQRNARSNVSYSSDFGRTYTGGLGWAGADGSFSGYYSHEKLKSYAHGYWGTAMFTERSGYLSTYALLLYDPTMHNKSENNTVSANATVNMPHGLRLKGMASHTRSSVYTPVYLENFQYGLHGTDTGLITDLSPSEVRINRFSMGLNWVPEGQKLVSVDAFYRTDDWTDKNDVYNNGRVDLYSLGLNLMF